MLFWSKIFFRNYFDSRCFFRILIFTNSHVLENFSEGEVEVAVNRSPLGDTILGIPEMGFTFVTQDYNHNVMRAPTTSQQLNKKLNE